MIRRTSRRAALLPVVALACVATVVAACSSSGSGSGGSGSGGNGSNSSAASGGDGGSNSSSSPGDKSTFKFMMINDTTSSAGTALTRPENAQVGMAMEKYINSKGGIAGHPVDLEICDAQGDVNQATSCARKAVSEHVVAALGGFTLNDQQVVPILEAGHVAYLPSYAYAPDEFTADNTFPLNSGILLLFALGADAGNSCKKPSIVEQATPTQDYNVAMINVGIKSAGKPAAPASFMPAALGDFSSLVAKAMSENPDCLAMYTQDSNSVVFFKAMASAGKHALIIGTAGTALGEKSTDSAAPSITEGGHVVSYYPAPDSSKWSKFNSIVDKYSDPSKYDLLDPQGEGTYLGWLVVEQVLGKLAQSGAAVDNESFLKAMNSASAVTTEGILPTLDFSKEWTVKGYERLFDRSVTFQRIKNQQPVPFNGGKYVDVGDAFVKAGGPSVSAK